MSGAAVLAQAFRDALFATCLRDTPGSTRPGWWAKSRSEIRHRASARPLAPSRAASGTRCRAFGHARQVHLDRLLSDEECLGDLAVRTAVGRHLRDAPLARRERVHAAQRSPAGRDAGGEQLGLGALGQWRRRTLSRAQARAGAAPLASERRFARRMAEPSSTRALACSRRAWEGSSTATASRSSASPSSPPSTSPAATSDFPRARGAPHSRASASSSAA